MERDHSTIFDSYLSKHSVADHSRCKIVQVARQTVRLLIVVPGVSSKSDGEFCGRPSPEVVNFVHLL